MRRLLALVPAVLLVLTLAPAPAAQAEVPHSIYLPCKTEPFPRSSIQVTIWWYASGVVTGSNHDIELLARIAITDTCRRHWAKLAFSGLPDGPYIQFAVAPGATRTLAQQGLVHLGIWQTPFHTWFINFPPDSTDPCTLYLTENTNFWVMADGSVTTTSPCP